MLGSQMGDGVDLTGGGRAKPERKRVTAKVCNSLCQPCCDNGLMIQKCP